MSTTTEAAAAAAAAAAATSSSSATSLQRIPKLGALSEAHVGTFVKLHGWVYSVRIQGAGTLGFVDVGDGTTVAPVRCLAVKPDTEGADPTLVYRNSKAAGSDGTSTSTSTSLLGTTSNANSDESYYRRLTFDELAETSNLSLGCSVMVLGYVDAPPEGTSQAFEVKILELFVIGGVEDPASYPMQKSILKKPAAMRGYAHARFRAPLIQQWMHIRSEALFAVHEFFHDEGVPLLDPNIMTANDCEGAGEVFKIAPQALFSKLPEPVEEDSKKKTKKKPKKKKGGDVVGVGVGVGVDAAPAAVEGVETTPSPSPSPSLPKEEEEEGKGIITTTTTTTTTTTPIVEVGLTVSSQLPLEAIAMGTGSVYTCQKSFRAEKSDTNKHLAEFLHVEYEEYFLTLDELIDQAERFVKSVLTKVLDRCAPQYRFLNQKHAAPPECHGHAEYLKTLLDQPFVRIRHKDAIEVMLQDLKDKVQAPNEQGKLARLKFKTLPKQGEDLGSEHEKYLVHKFGTFCFVTHWPSKIKSFYMKQTDDGEGTCESFDLLAPLVGELFGGSMREWRYDVLMEQMTSKNMDIGGLQWFVDLRKSAGGTAPHGGWGMGFDRLVMFLTNASSVRDIVPYPVYYGHCPY